MNIASVINKQCVCVCMCVCVLWVYQFMNIMAGEHTSSSVCAGRLRSFDA